MTIGLFLLKMIPSPDEGFFSSKNTHTSKNGPPSPPKILKKYLQNKVTLKYDFKIIRHFYIHIF